MDYLKRVVELLEDIKVLLERNNVYATQEETLVYPKDIKSESSKYIVSVGYLEEDVRDNRMNPLYNKTLWSIFSKLYAGGIEVKSFTVYKLKKEERSKLSNTLNFMLRNYDKIYPAYRVLLSHLSQIKDYKNNKIDIDLKDVGQESVNELLKLLSQLKGNIIQDYKLNENQKILTITNISDINFLRGAWFEQAMQLNLPNFFLEANPYEHYIFLGNIKYETKYGKEGEIDGMVMTYGNNYYKRLFILEYKSGSLEKHHLSSLNTKFSSIKTYLYQFFKLHFYIISPRKLDNSMDTSNYIFTLCSANDFVSKLKQDMSADNG
jgi:hypothetical protein